MEKVIVVNVGRNVCLSDTLHVALLYKSTNLTKEMDGDTDSVVRLWSELSYMRVFWSDILHSLLRIAIWQNDSTTYFGEKWWRTGYGFCFNDR